MNTFNNTFHFNNFKLTARIDGEIKNGEIKEILFSVKPMVEDVAEQAVMLMLAVYRKLRAQISLFDLLIDKGKNLKGQLKQK